MRSRSARIAPVSPSGLRDPEAFGARSRYRSEKQGFPVAAADRIGSGEGATSPLSYRSVALGPPRGPFVLRALARNIHAAALIASAVDNLGGSAVMRSM